MREADYEACSTEELTDAVRQLHALIGASQAQLFAMLRVLAGREAFREDGCRDLAGWLVQLLGLSGATARAWADTAGALGQLPELESLLSEGRVSLDQLRPVAKVATPESEAAFARELPGLSAAAAEALGRRAGARPARSRTASTATCACATGAAASRAVAGGASCTDTTSSTGARAAPPTAPTCCCCVGAATAACTRAAGGSRATRRGP